LWADGTFIAPIESQASLKDKVQVLQVIIFAKARSMSDAPTKEEPARLSHCYSILEGAVARAGGV